jgi:hypothetical protein
MRCRSATAGVHEQTTRERRQQIHDLLDKVVGLLECGRRLHLSLNTVKLWCGPAEGPCGSGVCW